ncbi:Twinkle protein, chloroplastic/mitochondrial, partial [Ananas comosus]
CKGGSSMERSLSVYIREDGGLALWKCFRGKCGWKGHAEPYGDVTTQFIRERPSLKVKEHRIINEEDLELEPLCKELIAYFGERMISEETLRRNAVMQRRCDNKIVIAFTYRRDGTLVSCKYREVSKKFWQERNTEKIFYGLDDIRRTSDIIIVEGEIDKLSMEEAGFRNCVSVPDGAPARVANKVPDEEEDTKFQYLWNCRQYLDMASRIILATDADPPGQALAEELARRIGKERCWRVQWPQKNSAEVCKDANEVLMYLGPDALRRVIENAELYPIRGLFTFSHFFPEIDAYYNGCYGYEQGISSGWNNVDKLYKVKEHARKLLEKHIRKPFFNARYADSVERMSVEEFEQGKEWLNDTFHLIRCEDDCLPSVKWVLDLAKAAVRRYGVRGLVIDPYNELDHQRPLNQSLHDEFLEFFIAKSFQFLEFLIAKSVHSFHLDNRTETEDPKAGPLDTVQVCVRKVRNKVAGSIGDAFLAYNRVTGEYMEVEDHVSKK